MDDGGEGALAGHGEPVGEATTGLPPSPLRGAPHGKRAKPRLSLKVFHRTHSMTVTSPTSPGSSDDMDSPTRSVSTPSMPSADDLRLGLIDHLVIVVHGVGDHTVRMQTCLKNLREACDDVISDHFESTQLRVEFRGVEWHSAITGTQEALAQITPKGADHLRKVTNNVLTDVLYYNSGEYQPKIVREVAAQLNAIQATVQEEFHGQKFKTSIFAHSLGSVIMYDLLVAQRAFQEAQRAGTAPDSPSKAPPQLAFPVENVFFVGSPLGLFLWSRGVQLDGRLPLPAPPIFNLFHPYDTVAYRLEPFINSALAEMDPVKIPHHRTSSGKRRHVLFKEAVMKVMRKRTAENPAPPSPVSSSTRRYDYALQPRLLHQMGETLSSIPLHRAYWHSKDVVLFVVSTFLHVKVVDVGTPGYVSGAPRSPGSPLSLDGDGDGGSGSGSGSGSGGNSGSAAGGTEAIGDGVRRLDFHYASDDDDEEHEVEELGDDHHF